MHNIGSHQGATLRCGCKNFYVVGDAGAGMEQAGRISDSSRLFYLSRNPLHSSCAFQPLMKQYVGVFEKVSVYV